MIVCVYSAGEEFKAPYVARLYDQIRWHMPRPVRFLCYTDRPDCLRGYGIATETLRHTWRDYWCKIEVLRTPGPCLYLDLDTTVVGDLTPMLAAVSQHDFIAITNLRYPGINSSVMAWRGDVSHMYRQFVVKPDRFFWQYRKTDNPGGLMGYDYKYTHFPKADHGVGDQGFIYRYANTDIARWQDILPGSVLSYKLEWMKGADRSNCRVVYFHGKPRPWDVPEFTAE